MIADVLFCLYIIFIAFYIWMMKYRYENVIEEYVKVKMKCSESPSLFALLCLFT